MRKNLLPLLLSALLLVTLACRAQWLDVQSPAAQGLVRGSPYLSNWSQRWLTNGSGVMATKMLFGESNSAAVIWSQLAPFVLVENTNALTDAQQFALRQVTAGYGVWNYYPVPDIVAGINATNSGDILIPSGLVAYDGAGLVVPIQTANQDSMWNDRLGDSLWTVQSAFIGNPQDTIVPTNVVITYVYPNFITNGYVNGIAQFQPTTFFDAILLQSSPGYVTNATKYPAAAQTNLWFVDKAGNQWLLGTNKARAFVGDMSRGTGITPGQVGAVPTSDATYLSIHGIGLEATNAYNSGVIASNSFAASIGTIQKNYTNTVAAPTNTTPFTVITPAFSPATVFTNTTGRRQQMVVNYGASNLAFGLVLSNLTVPWGLFITNSSTNTTTYSSASVQLSPNDVFQYSTNGAVKTTWTLIGM